MMVHDTKTPRAVATCHRLAQMVFAIEKEYISLDLLKGITTFLIFERKTHLNGMAPKRTTKVSLRTQKTAMLRFLPNGHFLSQFWFGRHGHQCGMQQIRGTALAFETPTP